MDRSEYPAMLESLQPSQAVALLNDRVKHVGKLNLEIADWLQERRRIEEQYAFALRKLSQKIPPDESSDLGIFTTPWQKITSGVAARAESHSTLAAKIEVDIESPLRHYHKMNREVQNMSTMQGNLQSLAKDYDSAQRKAERLQAKGGKGAAKAAGATSEVGDTSSQWQSQAPYVFEALQAVDESRCNNLRDILTQFQTHEIDQVDKNRKIAESTLNSLLTLDTADEVKTFAVRSTGSSSTQRRTERRMSRGQSSFGRSQSSNLMPPPPIPAASDDRTSQRSASIHEDTGEKPPQPEKKGRLGGLKRLGTVIGRRRQSMQPGGYGRNTQPPGKVSNSNLASSTTANGDERAPSREQNSEPLGTIRSNTTEESATGVTASEFLRPERTTSRSMPGDSNITTTSTVVNGTTSLDDTTPTQETSRQSTIPESPPVQPLAPQETQKDSEGFNVPVAANDPISQAQAEAAALSDTSANPFKVDIRNAPITEENANNEAAIANMASTLRAQATPRRTGTVRGRRDRNTVILPEGAPISQTFSEETSVFNNQPPVQSPPALERSQFVESPSQQTPPPSQPSMSISSLHSASPQISQQPHRQTLSEVSGPSDAQSIKSSSTTSMSASKHPDLSAPGLQSSTVETISVWLERGQVTRALVFGELAFTHNPDISSFSSSLSLATTIPIRLSNASLEKVVPNPNFIAQSAGSGTTEYTLDTATLRQISATSSSSPNTPHTALKYQARLSPETLQLRAPIIITPSWKVETNQTSVILLYAPNPLVQTPVTLHKPTFIIHLETSTTGTGRPTSCLSRPQGQFSKDRSAIFWRLDESLTLQPGMESQKLLARFATEGEAKPGRVEVKFELFNYNPDRPLTSNFLSTGVSPAGLGGVEGDSAGVAIDQNQDGILRSIGSGIGVEALLNDDQKEDNPFDDESGTGSSDVVGVKKWKNINVVRRIGTGNYSAI